MKMNDEIKAIELNDDDDFEDIDETIWERVYGLTEMFPQSVRNYAYNATNGSLTGVRFVYTFGRSLTWILFTTTAILVAPLALEMERSQLEEYNKQQQRQILLGPNASLSGTPSLPNLTPVPQR